jgi:hypothetical protein
VSRMDMLVPTDTATVQRRGRMRFRLEFDFPLFMFVTWGAKQGVPKNLWKSLGLVQTEDGLVQGGITRGQVSCVICGYNFRQYTAYCLATGCDGDLFPEDDGHFMPDPIVSTSGDVHDVEQSKRPREYFLDALTVRVRQTRAGWETIMIALERLKDQSVSLPRPAGQPDRVESPTYSPLGAFCELQTCMPQPLSDTKCLQTSGVSYQTPEGLSCLLSDLSLALRPITSSWEKFKYSVGGIDYFQGMDLSDIAENFETLNQYSDCLRLMKEAHEAQTRAARSKPTPAQEVRIALDGLMTGPQLTHCR